MPALHQLARAEDLLSKHMARHGETHCLSVVLEIADRCNETCAHCFQEQGNKGELDTDAWKKVIDDLAELGVLMLTFSGGEATLRGDLFELITHARQRGFAVKLFTNGVNIDEAFAKRLAKLAVHEVQLSLYSHRPEVHDWITGLPGSQARTSAAITHLVAAGIHVLAKSPTFSVNVDEVDAHIAYVEGLGADFSFDIDIKARETGERDPQALKPTHGQSLEMLKKPVFRDEGPDPIRSPRTSDNRPCNACRTMTVEANGEVRACSALTVSLGNAMDEGVVAAYRDGEISNFIRELAWGDLVGCRQCELSGECQRCYSEARFEVGDALRPYASACAKALLARELRLGRPVVVEGAKEGPPLGPFRMLAEDRAVPFEPEVTERDRAMREQQPWILHDAQPPAPPATETGLVQIRRPGRKKPIGGKLPLAAGTKP